MPRKPAQEMYETLQEMAENLFGEEDSPEKDNYVTEHMKRLGYKMRVIFDDADDDGNNDNSFTSSIFGSKRERRDVSRKPGQRQSSGGFGMGGYQ